MVNTAGYVVIGVDRRLHYAHRLAWLYVYAAWPRRYIDHINGCRADNRLVNLRDVTQSENSANRCVRPLQGVYKPKNSGRYAAEIKCQGKKTFLGMFDTAEAAHKAYCAAAETMFSGFRRGLT